MIVVKYNIYKKKEIENKTMICKWYGQTHMSDIKSLWRLMRDS